MAIKINLPKVNNSTDINLQRGTNTNFNINDIEKTKIREQKANLIQKKKECKANGGTWDEGSQKCILPIEQQSKNFDINNPNITNQPETITETPGEQPKAKITTPEIIKDSETGRISGIKLPDGKTFFGISPQEAKDILANYQKTRTAPEGTLPAGTQQAQLEQQLKAQELSGQIGQFGELGVNPTGLDFEEATVAGIRGAIPRALSLAATGAGIGIIGGGGLGTAILPGAGTAAGVAAGAAIGAIGGFVSGISSSMLSNLRSQRTDTTTAQQRVLDEGKQNLNDWATLAGTDPANRAVYVKNFNQQLALINQAYRQMKLDTSRDVAKFETALPNLAEFETFYSTQGERDFLVQDMQNSLLQPGNTDYKMIELAQRKTPKGGK